MATTNYTTAAVVYRSDTDYDGDSGAVATLRVAGVGAVVMAPSAPGVVLRVASVNVVEPPAGVRPPTMLQVAGVAAYVPNRRVTVLVGGIAATTFNGAGLWKKTADGWTAHHGYHKLSNGDWLRLI